jgi:type 1 glutamine amidotransferase
MKTTLKKSLSHLAALTCAAFTTTALAEDDGSKTINALLLTGGGYHDYQKQKTILSEGIEKRLNIKWTIVDKDAGGTKELLSAKGWADGFDVVVYNICHANETDGAFVKSVTDTHSAGLPAVIIHCSLHSYHWKTKTDDWVRFIGVTSMRHGKQHPITITSTASDHPIMKKLPAKWITPAGELYHIDKVWDTATVLADGTIDDGESKHAVAWVNEFGKSKVFGFSVGHHNETVASDDFLNLVANGMLWVTGNLKDDGTPAEGTSKK